jgi:hypothetical protein
MTTSAAERQSARVSEVHCATGWLALAASPVFALMAWITANDSGAMTLCSAGSSMLPIGGMPAMYLLMSLFHLPAWLELLVPLARR